MEATSRIQDTSEAPKDESQGKLWKSHKYPSGILETILFHLGLEISKQGIKVVKFQTISAGLVLLSKLFENAAEW